VTRSRSERQTWPHRTRGDEQRRSGEDKSRKSHRTRGDLQKVPGEPFQQHASLQLEYAYVSGDNTPYPHLPRSPLRAARFYRRAQIVSENLHRGYKARAKGSSIMLVTRKRIANSKYTKCACAPIVRLVAY